MFMGYEFLDYGFVNPCLVCETRKWQRTARLDFTSKAIIHYKIAWFVTILLYLSMLCCVLLSPICSLIHPFTTPLQYISKYYSHLHPINYPINSYSDAMPLMLPLCKQPLMFPSPTLVATSHFSYHMHVHCSLTPILKSIITHIYIYIPSLDKVLFSIPPKLGCLDFVVYKQLLTLLSNRLIYMYMASINAINHTTLDILFTHVHRYYATTLYLGLPINTPHLYFLNHATYLCLIKLYAVLIFCFTWLLYRCIKLPQFASKTDVYLLRVKLLEKSPLAFTFCLLNIFSVQMDWINTLYLGPVVRSLVCYILQIYGRTLPMIPYMMMNLRYFTCHNIIFYSVQTLTFIKAVFHICTAIRQISLYILYLIHPVYNPVRTWAIFSKCSHVISTIIPYQYCKYMYIYNKYHHHQISSRSPPNITIFTQNTYLLQKIYPFKTFANCLDQDQARLNPKHFCILIFILFIIIIIIIIIIIMQIDILYKCFGPGPGPTKCRACSRIKTSACPKTYILCYYYYYYYYIQAIDFPCKWFGTRSGPTKCWTCSRPKTFVHSFVYILYFCYYYYYYYYTFLITIYTFYYHYCSFETWNSIYIISIYSYQDGFEHF